MAGCERLCKVSTLQPTDLQDSEGCRDDLHSTADIARKCPYSSTTVFISRIKRCRISERKSTGFDYASTEIAIDDDEDENDDISDENSVERARRTPSVRGSLQRVNMIRRWMTKFPSMTVRLDSHSGIIAPSEIAEAFSRTRGMAVRSALQSGLDENKRSEIDIRDRISVHPWGRRVALLVAAEPSHPFRDLARCGKGWVQICVELDGMHVPPDPFFDSDLNVCLTES